MVPSLGSFPTQLRPRGNARHGKEFKVDTIFWPLRTPKWFYITLNADNCLKEKKYLFVHFFFN